MFAPDLLLQQELDNRSTLLSFYLLLCVCMLLFEVLLCQHTGSIQGY
jgi:hypothetical protein